MENQHASFYAKPFLLGEILGDMCGRLVCWCITLILKSFNVKSTL